MASSRFRRCHSRCVRRASGQSLSGRKKISSFYALPIPRRVRSSRVPVVPALMLLSGTDLLQPGLRVPGELRGKTKLVKFYGLPGERGVHESSTGLPLGSRKSCTDHGQGLSLTGGSCVARALTPPLSTELARAHRGRVSAPRERRALSLRLLPHEFLNVVPSNSPRSFYPLFHYNANTDEILF